MGDSLQTCLNTMGALQHAASHATAYRMHCKCINACAQGLRGLMEETQKELIGIGKTDAARRTLKPLILTMEDAAIVIRRCNGLTFWRKVADQGETKRHLTEILQTLCERKYEVRVFLQHAVVIARSDRKSADHSSPRRRLDQKTLSVQMRKPKGAEVGKKVAELERKVAPVKLYGPAVWR